MDERRLREIDPEVYAAIRSEINREKNNLLMIASENYASLAVIEAQANVMTNKYAEGYPGARYYGGCEFVDVVERLAIERAKKLFGAEHVNVQPHSGSQANMAVYLSFFKPGDVIMGMDLSHGGHLTHGSPASFSGTMFKSVSYGLNPKSQRIDYDQIRDVAKKHSPRVIVAGASAYPRIIDFKLFKEIAEENNAYLMADMAHIAGLVATGLHPSPVGVADFVTTTTHKTLRGPRGGLILAQQKYAEKLDKALFPGIQGGPLMHIIAAKAVSFQEALRAEFSIYQRQVVDNARVLAEELLNYGFDLVTGGTDNHLILVDLTKRGITGLDAERALGLAGIVANKNAVPFDKRGPKTTSGLRLGTPALTTRGMKENEMSIVAGLIREALEHPESETVLQDISRSVAELCSLFPVYENLDRGHDL
ncbi:serine hydroxymethyltransferase [uncultured Desulfobacterium sp.]|uniref:Serine hydroxymethyltransferase n=1 Tax=uncultured Desulfobacterium sp. TaxID=201089 RepID=A0A445N3F0_9BACT|nr:serine hydroxymethyltransferase [uncultured Desulfobacterium sp.]